MATVIIRSKAAAWWPGIFGYGGYYDSAREHSGYNLKPSLEAGPGSVGQLYYKGQYECLQTVFLFDTRSFWREFYRDGQVVNQVTGAKLSALCAVDATDTDFTIEVRAIPVSDSSQLAYMADIFSTPGDWSSLGFWNWYTKGTGISVYPLVAHYNTAGLIAGKSFDFVDDSLIANIRTNNITTLLFNSDRQRLSITPSGREWMSIETHGNTPILTVTYGPVVSRVVGSSVSAAATLRQAIITTTSGISASSIVAGANETGTKYGFIPAKADIWEAGEMVGGFIATAEIAPREEDVTSGFSPDFSGLAVL